MGAAAAIIGAVAAPLLGSLLTNSMMPDTPEAPEQVLPPVPPPEILEEENDLESEQLAMDTAKENKGRQRQQANQQAKAFTPIASTASKNNPSLLGG